MELMKYCTDWKVSECNGSYIVEPGKNGQYICSSNSKACATFIAERLNRCAEFEAATAGIDPSIIPVNSEGKNIEGFSDGSILESE